MILHQKNVGREVILDGEKEKIGYVCASGEWFRLKDTGTSAVHREYTIKDIQAAAYLTVSFDGLLWCDVMLNREDLPLKEVNEIMGYSKPKV